LRIHTSHSIHSWDAQQGIIHFLSFTKTEPENQYSSDKIATEILKLLIFFPANITFGGTESAVMRFGMQLQTQRIHDLEDGVKTGTTFTRERLVETFAGQAGVTRDLCHALGTGDIAQRLLQFSISWFSNPLYRSDTASFKS